MRFRKIIKTRGHFPGDEAATKLINTDPHLARLMAELLRDTVDFGRVIARLLRQFAYLVGHRGEAAPVNSSPP